MSVKNGLAKKMDTDLELNRGQKETLYEVSNSELNTPRKKTYLNQVHLQI